MTLLAIETSCDETSVALVRDGTVLGALVASQVDLHAEYGGVVPELAAREHLRNLPRLLEQIRNETGVTADQLDAVAATQGPGLPNALLVGLKTGQAIAHALDLPFLGVHHHEAHLYSPWIAGQPPRAHWESFEPNVSLIVSGGHTLLVDVQTPGRHRVLGGTVDDAAGECFDKTGKLLGLPYPAGPEIDRLAGEGNPAAHEFPRPMIRAPHHDFSFSGLKTSVRYFLRDHSQAAQSPNGLRDLCASIQAAIVDVLVAKTLHAASACRTGCVTASGGVSCNRRLRQRMQDACRTAGLKLRLATPSLCTDNAAIVGILAERRLALGAVPTSYDAEIRPSWALDETAMLN